MLVGNPNVGKSVIFGFLTGKYVTVSNYPGTTVEVSRGTMRYGGRDWEVIDTPGVNSLVPQSEDERVTRDLLLEAAPDVIVQVADAKNLRRTLLLTTQLAEFGAPLVLVLNLMDEARSRNIEIDAAGLSQRFGIPVVPAVAIEGEGLRTLFNTICHAAVPQDPLAETRRALLERESAAQPLVTHGKTQLVLEWLQTPDASLRRGVETWLSAKAETCLGQTPNERLRLRTLAARLEEMRNAFLDEAVAQYKTTTPNLLNETTTSRTARVAMVLLALGLALFAYTEAGRLFGWPTPYAWCNAWLEQHVIPVAQGWLAARHLGALGALLFGQANASGAYENGFLYPAVTQLLWLVAPVVVPAAILLPRSRSFAERLGHWARDWRTGFAILLVVMLLMYEFVGVLGAGTLVDALENTFFNQMLTPRLQAVLPQGFVYDLLVGQYGLISVGLTYALAIVLPIVLTFFLAFGLLEDSGYLPRLAILADRGFRVMGLNGKAVLPMVLGLGCDTMATMTTRILGTPKERFWGFMQVTLRIEDLLNASSLAVYEDKLIKLAGNKAKKLKDNPEIYQEYAGEIVQLLGKFKTASSNAAIRQFVDIRQHYTKQLAVMELLKNRESVAPSDLDTLAKDKAIRVDFYKDLKSAGLEKLFPSRYKTKQAFAESYLYSYLSDDYGDIEKINFVQIKSTGAGKDERQYYCFRFRAEEDENESLGIVGPFAAGDSSLLVVNEEDDFIWVDEEPYNSRGISAAFQRMIDSRSKPAETRIKY